MKAHIIYNNYCFHRYFLNLRALLLIGFTTINFSTNAQEAISREYQVKAVFLYNFSHFIDWENKLNGSPSEPFVIGILGDDPFKDFLDETVKGEKILGHSYIIQRYNNVKDIKSCQILFINLTDKRQVKEALASLSVRHILTVSDMPNFAKMGGIIQFFTENNKTRLLINVGAAKAADLYISSKLLRLAQTFNVN